MAPSLGSTSPRGDTVSDGRGRDGEVSDVVIKGDRIVAIGELKDAQAKTVIDGQASQSHRASSTCSRGRTSH